MSTLELIERTYNDDISTTTSPKGSRNVQKDHSYTYVIGDVTDNIRTRGKKMDSR